MTVTPQDIRDAAALGPRLSARELADRFNVSYDRAWRALHPDRIREENKRRRAQKRAHEQGPSNRSCGDCGRAFTRASAKKDPVRCAWCDCARRRAGRDARRARIRELWDRGLTLKQIAAELDSTRNAVQTEITKMRAAGIPIPYRHHGVYTEEQRAA